MLSFGTEETLGVREVPGHSWRGGTSFAGAASCPPRARPCPALPPAQSSCQEQEEKKGFCLGSVTLFLPAEDWVEISAFLNAAIPAPARDWGAAAS